jgi:Tfp pilus assembly protein PilO
VPADQIFVLMLVVGIVLGFGWLSWYSRQREKLNRQAPPQSAPSDTFAEEANEPATARPQRRRG